MSDPKRANLITVGVPKSAKKIVNKTVRLNINLVESNESKYPELNYKELVIAEERKSSTENGKTGGLDPFSDNDDDVERVARKFEQKYGNNSTYGKKKRRSKDDDFADIGAGYDENDSFIDNTHGYDEMIPPDIDTYLGGFYINCGSLEFKTVPQEPSAAEDEPRRKRRRISSSSSEEESSDSSSDSASQDTKDPKAIANGDLDSHKTEHRKKKNKKDKLKAKKIRRADSSAASGKQTSDDNMHPDGESVDSRTSHSDSLTSKPAPSSENAITSDSSRDVDMKSETKLPQPVIQMLDSLEAAAAKYLLAHPAAPGATLMAHCETNLQRLEHALLNSSSNVVRAARNKAARTLGVTRAQIIQRNDKTVPQPTSTSDPAQPTTTYATNTATTTATAAASTTSKNKRKAVVEDTLDISKLSDDEREEMIVETIKRLMDLIEEFKPSMFASYNKECERVKEEKKKLLSDGATVDKRLPKRRFPWCHRSRSLLARITTLAGSEEASAVLLADRVLPLFPKGFVRMPTLMRQANISKNMKIPEIKRQRHGSAPTVPITLHSHPSITPTKSPPAAAPLPPKVQTPPLFPEQIQFPSSLTVTATVKSPEKDHLPPVMNAFSLSKDLIVEREREKTDKKEDLPYIPPNNIGSITITPVPTKDKKIDKQKADRPSSKPQSSTAEKTPSLIRVKSPAALNDAFNKKEVKTKKPDKPKDKRLDTPLQIDTNFQNSQPKQSHDSPKNKDISPKETLTSKQIESLRVKENNIPRPTLVPVHHSPTFAKPEKRPEVKKTKEVIPEVKKKKEIMIVSDLDPLSDVEPVAVDDSSSDVEVIENDKCEVPFKDNKVPKSEEPNEYISRVMKDIREMEHSQEPTKLSSNSFAGIISNNSNAKHRSDANRNGLCGTRSDTDKFAERTSLNKTDGCNGNTG